MQHQLRLGQSGPLSYSLAELIGSQTVTWSEIEQ